MTKSDWEGLSRTEAESFLDKILQDPANIKRINVDIETGEYNPIVVPNEVTSKYPGTLLALSVTSEALGRVLIRDILERNFDTAVDWLINETEAPLFTQVYNQPVGYFIDRDGNQKEVYGFSFILAADDNDVTEFGFATVAANVSAANAAGPTACLPAISVFDFN